LIDNVDTNQLSGEIPSELGLLSSLLGLRLYDNQLSGEIPSSFRNLSILVEFKSYNNMLEGAGPEIPESLSTCDVFDNPGLCETFGLGNVCTFGLATCVTDCVIMNAWLPAMFNGTGIECCSQAGIICVSDRITEMYDIL
jgi:hypothetical protein